MKSITKNIVNREYTCRTCVERCRCEYWNGMSGPGDCGCDADIFAEGIIAAMEYLGELPWDEALNLTKKYFEEKENELK